MSELREAARAVLGQWDRQVLWGGDDQLFESLRAALAQPKTELRDQHKAFTHWYFGLRGINEANFNPEYLAWAAWKAALAELETEAPRYVGDARKHVICICPDCVATNYRGWREAVLPLGTKKAKCYEVLDLMRRNKVSIKDLSFVIAEFSVEGGLKETQQKIKGFLYTDKNMIEPDTSKE